MKAAHAFKSSTPGLALQLGLSRAYVERTLFSLGLTKQGTFGPSFGARKDFRMCICQNQGPLACFRMAVSMSVNITDGDALNKK